MYTSTVSEKLTIEYTKDRYRPDCPHCKAKRLMHEIRNPMELWKDAQVFCTFCDNYLWLWDYENDKRI